VTNVQAEQVQGTKDVSIQAEFTGKKEGAYDAMVHGEIWFKENEAMTTWTKVSSIYGELTPGSGNLEALNLMEWNPDTAQDELYPTIDLGQIGDTPQSKTLVWKAGDDAPNINTSNAKIRIIAFYPKMLEDGVTEKPMSEQTSGWNGEGNFGGSGGSPDGNGTAGTDTNGTNEGQDVYYLDSTKVGEATSYAKEDPGYYAFEAFYDEPAEHNGFAGTEVKQLIAVYDDAGTWRHDAGIGPWQLNPSLFPTLDSVGDWIATNALVSQGKVTYSDPAAGGGF